MDFFKRLFSKATNPAPAEPSEPDVHSFTCAACGAVYGIERRKLGSRGIRIHCGQCKAVITVRLDAPAAVPPAPNAVVRSSADAPALSSTRPSFDQCTSWLRVLMDTPARASTDTMKEPWKFAPTCSRAAVAEFEQTHGITLPEDYVRFITEVGNGTTGGGAYDVFPLGMTVRDDGYGPLIPFKPSVPDALARPFQHGLATWSGGDFADEIEEYTDECGEPAPTFDAEITPGAFPVAYEGCGEWCYLAINGTDGGTVWEWANGWLAPVPTQWLRPVNFTEWILGEVARQRGLIHEFRELTGVALPQ